MRSTSCRPITSASAAASAATSRSPGQPQRDRDVVGRARAFQLGEEPQPRCANDNGHQAPAAPARPGRSRGLTGFWFPTRLASPAAVGASNTAGSSISTPSTARTRLTSRDCQQRVPAQGEEVVIGPDLVQAQDFGERRAARISSRGGGRAPASQQRRRRSPARAAPRGPASRSPSAAAGPAPPPPTGTMYSGSRPAANARTTAPAPDPRPGQPRPGRPPRRRRPTSRRSPGMSSRAATAAWPTPGAAGQHRLDLTGLDPEPPHLHLVISPPAETPAPRQRSTAPRSPVRYIRCPVTGPERVSHEPLRRQPGRPTYPRATRAPAMIQLPRHPRRHRAEPLVQHEHPAFPPPAARPAPPAPPAPPSASPVVATPTVASVGP